MSEFRMPSLGADMQAGTLVEWRVRPGDAVRRGDIVAVVDTDKAVIEVEIWQDGVVDQLLVAAGQKVPVGTPLARLRAAGETPPPPAPAASAAPRPTEGPAPAPRAIGTPAATLARPAPTPVPVATPPPTRRVHATPLARRIAQALGVDIAAVEGTGPGGAVTRADVERVASPPRAAGAPAAAAAPPPADLRAARARQAMAAAMARSKREIPHYYLTTRIDLSRALAWLAAENARRAVADRLLPAALLLRAVALAAREAPEMNGFFVDGVLRPAACVHLGVGVALRQGGLVAPTLRDADTKDVSAVMRELAELVARTRAGVLRSSELGDATLTVTNLGDQGAESVHGVIYPPQIALVGFGRIAEQPWAHEGFLGVRPVVVATLAADHRASDGHRGSRFLAAVDRLLQAPEQL
jgi:pyruvate dehydrogenase E2 component (dihydrolipoamide acetyltransferase)